MEQIDLAAPVSDAAQRGHSEAAPPKARGWITPAALGLALSALFLLGYLPRTHRRAVLAADSSVRAAEPEPVVLAKPKRKAPARVLSLPCNLEGLEETVIYARSDGYLASFFVDLGDQVSEGQVLAELDTPEATQELAQAQEQLAQSEAALLRAQAARDHSAASLRRYVALAAGLASREELEQKQTQAQLDAADVHVAEAARNAQRANLERLKLRQAFAKVRAPFTGTITARTVERGSLVAAGRASPLFKLTTLHTLRAFVQVPQAHVAAVQRGVAAEVTVAEYPGRKFAATVHRTAQALDSGSRTMAVELRVPNAERKLLPGMYGSATLTLEADSSLFSVPATSLIMGEEGIKVARVDAGGEVHLVPVVVERDRGAEVEIASGLSGDEQIVINPSPSLSDGQRVRAAAHSGGPKS